MASRKSILFLLLAANLALTPSSNAMYKGENAEGNQLVVATGRGCSGTLVAPQVVALAAHCTYEQGLSGIFAPGGKQTIDPASRKCGNSCDGFKVQGDFARAIARIAPSGNYQQNRALDVALWVLDREIKIDPKVQIASESDIERFSKNNSTVIQLGYGQTGAKDFPELPSLGNLKFSPQDTVMEGVKELSNQGYTQFTAIGGWTPCSGDSGGPLYVEENGVHFYLGNVVSTSVAGCFSEVKSSALVTANLLYKHLYLIAEADTVISNYKVLAAKKATADKLASEKAALLKKLTIVCVKGKVSKKVTGLKPKCPVGYKKKA
jgi:secreted trypsin-like serine protease